MDWRFVFPFLFGKTYTADANAASSLVGRNDNEMIVGSRRKQRGALRTHDSAGEAPPASRPCLCSAAGARAGAPRDNTADTELTALGTCTRRLNPYNTPTVRLCVCSGWFVGRERRGRLLTHVHSGLPSVVRGFTLLSEIHFECFGAPARDGVGVEMRGSPPSPQPLCVCGAPPSFAQSSSSHLQQSISEFYIEARNRTVAGAPA